MAYSYTQVQGQQSVGLEDNMETNSQTEAIALPPMLMQSVKITHIKFSVSNMYHLSSVSNDSTSPVVALLYLS